MPKLHPEQSILLKAQGLVYGDRNKSYSHPYTDYETTAAMWSAILGFPVTPYKAALCMIAVKLSRASRNVGHEDSLVDMAGYAAVAHEIHLAETEPKLDLEV
jgi:hypothetical protein